VHGLRLIVQSVVDRLDHHQCRQRCRSLHCHPTAGQGVRWNLWILDAIKDQISALAADGISRRVSGTGVPVESPDRPVAIDA